MPRIVPCERTPEIALSRAWGALSLPCPFFMTAQTSAFFSFVFIDFRFSVFFYT